MCYREDAVWPINDDLLHGAVVEQRLQRTKAEDLVQDPAHYAVCIGQRRIAQRHGAPIASIKPRQRHASDLLDLTRTWLGQCIDIQHAA
jgi:hypothetical protein